MTAIRNPRFQCVKSALFLIAIHDRKSWTPSQNYLKTAAQAGRKMFDRQSLIIAACRRPAILPALQGMTWHCLA
ncbi:hypothetical protein [Polaromonas sp.]|uniref:hypothetical protein n=1 Tax=Polaromonas sp. TaxID=1869339 RepID=UPI0025DABA0F|nr:hypothetical protein [Polaromonas sp.]